MGKRNGPPLMSAADDEDGTRQSECLVRRMDSRVKPANGVSGQASAGFAFSMPPLLPPPRAGFAASAGE